MRLKLRLQLDVEYEMNGTSKEELVGLLKEVVDYAMNRGMVTGETPALVEYWQTEITESEIIQSLED